MSNQESKRDLIAELAFTSGQLLGLIGSIKRDDEAMHYLAEREYALGEMKRLEAELKHLGTRFYIASKTS